MVRDNRLNQIETAMQTGSREGMFTMEAYYTHFLARQTRFVPPQETFRPSPEKTSETPYQSSLLQTKPTAVNTDGWPVSVADRPSYSGRPASYEIQEEATMLELIEELKREEGQEKREDSSPR